MRYFVLIVALWATGACHVFGDDPPANYPAHAPFDQSKLPVGAGDKINLTVYYGAHSLNAAYTLDSSGEIAVQFIGNVMAAGKTLEQLRDEIQKKLADGFLNDPIVSISFVEINSQSVSVSGMVTKTGSVKFAPGMTVVDVIAQSGGFTAMARKNMVKVTRSVDGTKQTYKLPVEYMAEGERPAFEMMPGDEVFVPERAW